MRRETISYFRMRPTLTSNPRRKVRTHRMHRTSQSLRTSIFQVPKPRVCTINCRPLTWQRLRLSRAMALLLRPTTTTIRDRSPLTRTLSRTHEGAATPRNPSPQLLLRANRHLPLLKPDSNSTRRRLHHPPQILFPTQITRIQRNPRVSLKMSVTTSSVRLIDL